MYSDMDNDDKFFLIYSKTDCRFCDLAKQLLLDEGYNYEIKMCDNDLKVDREGFFKLMNEKIGYEHKTFPMIFHKNQFVGGYSELVKLLLELECFN